MFLAVPVIRMECIKGFPLNVSIAIEIGIMERMALTAQFVIHRVDGGIDYLQA